MLNSGHAKLAVLTKATQRCQKCGICKLRLNQTKPNTRVDLILYCHHSSADVHMDLSVVVPVVLTSAGEPLHQARDLIDQWLLTTHAADIQRQRICSALLTLAPKQTTLDCKDMQIRILTFNTWTCTHEVA